MFNCQMRICPFTFRVAVRQKRNAFIVNSVDLDQNSGSNLRLYFPWKSKLTDDVIMQTGRGNDNSIKPSPLHNNENWGLQFQTVLSNIFDK